jgi:hypothetical protein
VIFQRWLFFSIKKGLDVEQATVEKDVEAEYKVSSVGTKNYLFVVVYEGLSYIFTSKSTSTRAAFEHFYK